MILSFESLIRISAPLTWRGPARTARRLEEFALTEAGSALDMLRAAELSGDPKLRRIFLRHAFDEARHARMFRELARRIDPCAGRDLSEYAQIHGHRQDLYERLGPVAFLAFVHLAEKKGASHFRALSAHFRGRPELEQLFLCIAKDERFHVQYSRHWLTRLEPRATRAMARSRAEAAWTAWKRAGRALGDQAARAFLALVYVLVLPPFALAQRLADPERTGWKKPRRARIDKSEPVIGGVKPPAGAIASLNAFAAARRQY